MDNQMKPVIVLPERFMDALAELHAVNAPAIGTVLNKAASTMRKLAARAAAVDDSEERRITPLYGPAVTFHGTLLAEFETPEYDNGIVHAGELWETAGGAWVAVHYARDMANDGMERADVTVIEPSDDELDRQCQVMEAFRWNNYARSSIARPLKWSLTRFIP